MSKQVDSIPKRILMVSAVGNNKWSGMGKWSYKIAEALEQEGHQATLWFREDLRQFQWMGRIAKYFTPFLVAWLILKKRAEYDTVVVHEPAASVFAFLRRILGRRLPPIICMCHNVESHCFRTIATATKRGYAATSLKNKILFHLFNRWLSDTSIWLSDKVVCLSTVDRRYIIEKLGRDERDVYVMVNGVDSQYFSPRSTEKRDGAPRVLFVGGWLDVKGRFVLPEIWQKVIDRVPEARLTAVGTGQPGESVLAWFQENVRETVSVVSRVDTEAEIQKFYQTHDILVMPSLTEGSPLSLLEAMANGMAVVASRAGGIPDIVPHEEQDGARLFPACDTDCASKLIVELLNEPVRIAELGNQAKRRAEECQWENSARVLLECMASL